MKKIPIILPLLCLSCCLVTNSILIAFVNLFDVFSKHQIDFQNVLPMPQTSLLLVDVRRCFCSRDRYLKHNRDELSIKHLDWSNMVTGLSHDTLTCIQTDCQKAIPFISISFTRPRIPPTEKTKAIICVTAFTDIF